MLRPNQNRRDERAKRARDTKNKVVPDLLRSCPRAKHDIAKVELIVDPPANVIPPQNGTHSIVRPDLKIRVKALDTLTAAARISDKIPASKRSAPAVKSRQQKPNVAVLNMASALRPGGGFLDGANSQEEFLCARTTLYPSLWDSFYRLPEVSGIFTPDVLVFRDHLPDAHDLHKSDRYFVDVISSSMLRFSDAKTEDCSCGVSYCDRHRDIVMRKMKAVMRIAQSKGVEKLVLGAWGCGAYGNPTKEIAKCWRKVIAGGQRQRRPNAERWEGINEIVFAVPDRTMLRDFELAFSDVLADDLVSPISDEPTDSGAEVGEEAARTSELLSRIAEIELQIEQVANSRLKNTLRDTLAGLQRELSQGSRARASKDEDQAPDEDEEDDDYVVSGFPQGSDMEDNSYYNLADSDFDSDAPNLTRSETYEFRPGAPGLDAHTSHDEESQDETPYPPLQRSPQFDAQTGWYSGSVDQLTAYLSSTGKLKTLSRESPDVMRPQSSSLPGLDAEALHCYLSRYEGSDVKDY